MIKKIVKILIVLLSIIILVLLSCFDIENIINWTLTKNLMTISSVLFNIIPLLFFIGIIYSFLLNKWAVRIERLSIGGFNVLLDNPDEIYKKSVRTFLDTKRTLFEIDIERDNFNDVLNSYYGTYEFFRSEMKILHKKRRKKNQLYEVTNEALKVLNNFLTKHQSDFRRWYDYVSKENEVECIHEEGKKIKFHLSTIKQIQQNYYRYNEICQDFKEVNEFFNNKISNVFGIDNQKWENSRVNAVQLNIQQDSAL